MWAGYSSEEAMEECRRRLKAELYDIDRELRASRVNIDRPGTYPGPPF